MTKPASKDFKLVFISSNDSADDQSYISTAFEKSVVSAPSPPQDVILRDYLKRHLTVSVEGKHSAATILDPDKCRLRLVASEEYGNGKLKKDIFMLGQTTGL